MDATICERPLHGTCYFLKSLDRFSNFFELSWGHVDNFFKVSRWMCVFLGGF